MPKEKIKALPGQAANHLVNEGIKNAFPEIIFRGGVNLEDGAKYRSSEFDMFIPVQEQHRLYSLASLAFVTTTAAVSMAAPMLTLVSVIARRSMDGCSASIRFWMPTSVIPTCVAALAGKSIKTVWPFPATIISLSPAGKRQ